MVLICTVNFLLIIILLLQKKFNSIKAVTQETNMTMNKCYLIGKHGKAMFNIHSNEMYRKLQEANTQNILYIKPTLCTLYAALSSKIMLQYSTSSRLYTFSMFNIHSNEMLWEQLYTIGNYRKPTCRTSST